jgi:rare lipoprotein A
MRSIIHAALRAASSFRAGCIFKAPALCFGVLLGMCAIAPASGEARDHHPHLDTSGRPRSGAASYYGTHAAGKRTASGARFAPNRMTAASRSLPLGTKAKVTNAANGKSVKVTVTDRGPYVKNRILDVSPGAARRLGMKTSGVSTVKIQPLHVPGGRR